MHNRPAPNPRRLFDGRCSRPSFRCRGPVQSGPLLGLGQPCFRKNPPPVPPVLIVVLSSSFCFSWSSFHNEDRRYRRTKRARRRSTRLDPIHLESGILFACPCERFNQPGQFGWSYQRRPFAAALSSRRRPAHHRLGSCCLWVCFDLPLALRACSPRL